MNGEDRRRVGPWRPRKSLGQHFLRDRSIIQKIVAMAGFPPSSHVLEVGPGLGALTIPLAASVGHLYAIEKDAGLAEKLNDASSNLTLTGIEKSRAALDSLYTNLLSLIENLP